MSKPEGFDDGPIDLGAQNNLGKGYGLGTIFYKKYSISNFTDENLFIDLHKALASYKELKEIVGDSILNIEVNTTLDDQSISEFRKKVAAKTLSEHTSESMAELIKEANDALPKFRVAFKKEIVRNRKFANHVKVRADFICEICGRKPFMQINGKPYAEADHVEPLGGSVRGKDSPDNMRCVCAQCHAILTHGSPEEVTRIFIKP
jgi:predicted restriction endonuclease